MDNLVKLNHSMPSNFSFITNSSLDYYSVIGDIIRMFALYSLLTFVISKKIKLPSIFLGGMAISFSSIALFAAANGHMLRSYMEAISTLVMLYIIVLQR
jgi:hypothetical protein